MQEVGKVKIEMQGAITKLENERSMQKDLREKLAELDTKLSGTFLKNSIIYSFIHFFVIMFTLKI